MPGLVTEMQDLANSTAKKRLTASDKRLTQLRSKLHLVQDKLRINGSNRHQISRQNVIMNNKHGSSSSASVSGSKRSAPHGGFHTDASAMPAKSGGSSTSVLKRSRRNSNPSSDSGSKVVASVHPLGGPNPTDSTADVPLLTLQSSDTSTIMSNSKNKSSKNTTNSVSAMVVASKSASSHSTHNSKDVSSRVLSAKEQAELERKNEIETCSKVKQACVRVLTKTATVNSHHQLFQRPVSPAVAPDYHNFIRCPMDFDTVQRKLDNDEYPSPYDFAHDMRLIFTNALYYNVGITGKIGKTAWSAWVGFEKQFNKDVVSHFEQARLTKGMYRIANMIIASPFDTIGWFMYPVCPEKLNVPDYYEKITDPMDFCYIFDRLHLYERFGDIMIDVGKIWENCLFYNGTVGTVPTACDKARDQFLKRIHTEFSEESSNWESNNPEWIDHFEPSLLRMSMKYPLRPSLLENEPVRYFHPSPQHPTVGRNGISLIDNSNSNIISSNNPSSMIGNEMDNDIEMANQLSTSHDTISDSQSNLATSIPGNNGGVIGQSNSDGSNLMNGAVGDEDDLEEDNMMVDDIDDPAVRRAFLSKILAKNSSDYRDLKELNFPQKQDLETGVAVLDGKYLEKVIDMLQPFSEDEGAEMELDVDSISPDMQVQLYCYLIDALKQQIQEENEEEEPVMDAVAAEEELDTRALEREVSDQLNTDDSNLQVSKEDENITAPVSGIIAEIEQDTPITNSNDKNELRSMDQTDMIDVADSFALDMDDEDDDEFLQGMDIPTDSNQPIDGAPVETGDDVGIEKQLSHSAQSSSLADQVELSSENNLINEISEPMAAEVGNDMVNGSESTNETEEKNGSKELSIDAEQLFNDMLGSESPVHELDPHTGHATNIAVVDEPQNDNVVNDPHPIVESGESERLGSTETESAETVDDRIVNESNIETDAVKEMNDSSSVSQSATAISDGTSSKEETAQSSDEMMGINNTTMQSDAPMDIDSNTEPKSMLNVDDHPPPLAPLHSAEAPDSNITTNDNNNNNNVAS